jgi:hypothetical protein
MAEIIWKAKLFLVFSFILFEFMILQTKYVVTGNNN